MSYYKKDGLVFYYNSLQIAQGLHEGKEPLTVEELEEHLKPSESVEVREVSVEELKGELQELLVRVDKVVAEMEKREGLKNGGVVTGAELGDGLTRGERDTGGVLDSAEEGSTGRGDAPR